MVKSQKVENLNVEFSGDYWELFLWTFLHGLLNVVCATFILPLLFSLPYSLLCLAKWMIKNTKIIVS